jgi:hypothetical protein
MPVFVKSWLVKNGVLFAVRRAVKFGKDTDWSKVKADFQDKAALWAPKDWFDDEARAFAGLVIDVCQAALSNAEDLQAVLDAVAQGDLKAGEAALVKLALDAYKAATEVEHHVVAAFKELHESHKAA